MRYRIVVGAALAGVLLIGCNSQTSAPSPAQVFPTASIRTRPNRVARVVPATPLPMEIPSPSPTLIVSPSPTVIPTPSPYGPPTSPTPTIVAEPIVGDVALDPAMAEASLVVAINRVRIANNLSPYKMSTDLSAVARAHSCDL